MLSNEEYTLVQDKVKHFKTVRSKFFIFTWLLLITEITLYIFTAGGLMDHGWMKYILFVSLFISISVANCIILGSASHEIENVNHTLPKKEMRRTHLKIVYSKACNIMSWIIAFINSFFAFSVMVNYAKYYSTWWMWIIVVIAIIILTIATLVQYWLVAELKPAVEKVQKDINALIESREL